ncbi:hypothetical protein [Sedimenticola sp.]|uniref:hypothetical protein n=1 Tax=Sedimenticola sp. TaxID=1940285 RepID=UPI003D14D3E6
MVTAPTYKASPDNIALLQDSSTKQVSFGTFVVASEELNRVPIRIIELTSPVEGSYALYLQKAMDDEFRKANRYSEHSDIRISGLLLENEINASGFDSGSASIKAEISVHIQGKKVYGKIHSAKIQWPSSWSGKAATEIAIKEYPKVYTKLLKRLFSDREFLKAIH